jgi:hypothetical protein
MRSPRWHLLAPLLTLMGAACSTALLPATPSEPLRATGGGIDIAVDRLLVGDDILASGVDDEAAVGVELTVTNRGAVPYRLNLARTSLWLELDPNHPQDTRSWAPIGAGAGTVPDDNPTVVADMPTLVVDPGHAVQAWVMFFGYRFDGSEVPRRVTVNVPGPDGENLRITVADPARGALRWRLPAQRSQWMVGFHNSSFIGGAFQGLAPATALARVARAGPFLWDIGLVSGVAIQQQGSLTSSTSAFSTLGLFAHLTLPVFGWGNGHDHRRVGVYAGGGSAVWVQVLTAEETRQKVRAGTTGVLSLDGGLELDVGSRLPATTPFPLDPQARVALPRWLIRIGYAQGWLDGAAAGSLVTSFHLVY